MMRFLLTLLFISQSFLYGVSYNTLSDVLLSDYEKQPFDYDLGVKILKGPLDDEPVMVCFHGYGSSNKFVDILRTYREIPNHLVSFNFPDYNLRSNSKDLNMTAFGTIKELLPALYVLKKIVVDGYVSRVDLYGFSAGGGALVNVIAVLNSIRYERELLEIGISLANRKVILNAIQKGYIVMDCPLKSMDEIIAFRGRSPEIEILENRYRNNCLVPIDSLMGMKDLSLNLLVHFQANDEALSNRDDSLFINRLRMYNCKGNTCAVIGNDGGHKAYHKSLWETYPDFIAERCVNSCIEYSR